MLQHNAGELKAWERKSPLLTIEDAGGDNSDSIREIVSSAFDSEVEADLVQDLLSDATAMPQLSLLALDNGVPVGHILFTAVTLDPDSDLIACILAPLSVIPSHQRQGVGRSLINSGVKRLREAGVDIAFVLGHPAYYRRHDFIRADERGFFPPYHIPEESMPAWMMRQLDSNKSINYRGKVICAKTLSKPEYWRE